MVQQNIRDYNDVTYSIEEGAALVKELNDRTRHNVNGYNSIAELASRVIALELASASNDGNTDFEVIYFGAGAIPNSTDGNTSSAVLLAHINAIGFTVSEDTTPILNITVLRTINGNQYWVKEQYLFRDTDTVGAWGTGSANGAIVAAQLIYLNGVTLQTVTGNESFTDLGDIGASTVEAAVNALDPVMNLYVGTEYYFTCVRNGNQETYLYTGALPATVGTGETETTSTNFDLQSYNAGQPTTQEVVPFNQFTIGAVEDLADDGVLTTPVEGEINLTWDSNNDTVKEIAFPPSWERYLDGLRYHEFGNYSVVNLEIWNLTQKFFHGEVDVDFESFDGSYKINLLRDLLFIDAFEPGDTLLINFSLGTRQMAVKKTNASGTYELDLRLYDTFWIELDAATVFSTVNVPTATRSAATWTAYFKGEFGCTIPTEISDFMTADTNGDYDDYDGSQWNQLVAEYIDGTVVAVSFKNHGNGFS